MASMNNLGDRGSPCRNPLACLNFLPEIPLSSTLEEDVARRVVIQSFRLCPKPRAPMTSMRKTQLSESNALEMASLMNRDGLFDLCRALMTLCTYRKLSCMHLFFMKAF